MKSNEQPLLPFGFLEQKTDDSFLPKYETPKNDNERLLNYQWAVLNGDKAAYGKMYELGKTVALRYIQKHGKSNAHIAALGEAEKEEKAHNAITYIIARYLKDKDFRITESFTSYLYLRVRHELFYRRKVDAIVDFVDMDNFDRGAE